MQSKNTLYLASSSKSRMMLLDQIEMPYTVIGQSADESKCDWGLPLPKLVTSIARYKMEHAKLPEPTEENQIIFVLTADTVTQDMKGNSYGKPTDREDALRMVKIMRDGSRVGTGFCIVKFASKNGAWQEIGRHEGYEQAHCEFDVPDDFLDVYFQKSVSLRASGGIGVERFGLQFFKTINGSFTTIIGLPLFELREALAKLGFYDASMSGKKGL
jgi:septum formation protein